MKGIFCSSSLKPIPDQTSSSTFNKDSLLARRAPNGSWRNRYLLVFFSKAGLNKILMLLELLVASLFFLLFS